VAKNTLHQPWSWNHGGDLDIVRGSRHEYERGTAIVVLSTDVPSDIAESGILGDPYGATWFDARDVPQLLEQVRLARDTLVNALREEMCSALGQRTVPTWAKGWESSMVAADRRVQAMEELAAHLEMAVEQSANVFFLGN